MNRDYGVYSAAGLRGWIELTDFFSIDKCIELITDVITSVGSS